MRNILINIVIFLVIVALGWFGVWPALAGWQQTKKQQTTLSRELAELEKREAQIRALENASTTLREKAALAEKLFPAEEGRETFVTDMESLAKANGLTLTTMSFDAAKKAKKTEETGDEEAAATKKKALPTLKKSDSSKSQSQLKPVGYRMAVTGPFASIKQFLSQLDQSPRYTEFTDLSISGGEGSYNLSLTGQIYTKPLPTTANEVKFSPSDWAYLDRPPADTTIPPLPDGSPGRADPLAKY